LAALRRSPLESFLQEHVRHLVGYIDIIEVRLRTHCVNEFISIHPIHLPASSKPAGDLHTGLPP
jgi:hypothetical protein